MPFEYQGIYWLTFIENDQIVQKFNDYNSYTEDLYFDYDYNINDVPVLICCKNYDNKNSLDLLL